MPWKKGQSGNPGGLDANRVKWKRQLEGLNTRAINRLEKLVDSEDDQIAFKAAKEILDRNMGKPRQIAEVGILMEGQMTHEQWLDQLE